MWLKSLLLTTVINGGITPSFKVDTQLNLWFDHWLAIGGNVIDLVCQLHNCSVRETLARLEDTGLFHYTQTTSASHKLSKLTQNWLIKPTPLPIAKKSPADEKEKEGYFRIIKVSDIQSPALIQYLESRKIDLDIARTYLKEVRFSPRTQLREYFALGRPNGNGFEARSKLFKGFVGTNKDITRIGLADWKSLSIFEGFFDYLAFLTHYNITEFQNSAIILNSTSLKKRALEEINQFNFSKIYLFLDNNESGKSTKAFFKQETSGIKVIDKSFLYENCKDFNKWLISVD